MRPSSNAVKVRRQPKVSVLRAWSSMVSMARLYNQDAFYTLDKMILSIEASAGSRDICLYIFYWQGCTCFEKKASEIIFQPSHRLSPVILPRRSFAFSKKISCFRAVRGYLSNWQLRAPGEGGRLCCQSQSLTVFLYRLQRWIDCVIEWLQYDRVLKRRRTCPGARDKNEVLSTILWFLYELVRAVSSE